MSNTIASKIAELKELILALETANVKIEKGVKAGVPQIRKAAQGIKVAAQEIRVLAMDVNFEAKA